MGDRFSFQQQQRWGKRRMAWTDEKNEEAIEAYKDEHTPPETYRDTEKANTKDAAAKPK